MGCGVLAYFCYSMQDTLVKVMDKVYSPIMVTWIDSMVALSLLIGFVWWRKGAKGLKILYHTHQRWQHMLRGAFFAIGTGMVFTGMAHVPLPNMYVIIFLSPLLGASLSGLFLKEPVGKEKFAALCLGFAGVVVALQPGPEGFNMYSLLILGAACMFSANAILNRFLATRDIAAPLISYPLTAVVVVWAVPMLFSFQPIALHHLLPFAMMGVCLLAALFLSARAFSYAPVYLVAPCQLLQFLWGSMAEFFLSGTWPGKAAGMGGLLIIVSNLLVLFLQYRQKRLNDARNDFENPTP